MRSSCRRRLRRAAAPTWVVSARRIGSRWKSGRWRVDDPRSDPALCPGVLRPTDQRGLGLDELLRDSGIHRRYRDRPRDRWRSALLAEIGRRRTRRWRDLLLLLHLRTWPQGAASLQRSWNEFGRVTTLGPGAGTIRRLARRARPRPTDP